MKDNIDLRQKYSAFVLTFPFQCAFTLSCTSDEVFASPVVATSPAVLSPQNTETILLFPDVDSSLQVHTPPDVDSCLQVRTHPDVDSCLQVRTHPRCLLRVL